MSASLASQDLQLAEPGKVQGYGLGDLFERRQGTLLPRLHPLEVPVRAFVAPVLEDRVAGRLLGAVQRHLHPLVPEDGVWTQDPGIYHATIYHASTHADPSPATPAAVDAEAGAALRALDTLCPLRVVLERVVATPGGVVLACWQTVKNGDILHTTLARYVLTPAAGPGGASSAQRLLAAADAMTRDLCGLEATLDRLWFVEEEDLLALALRGRYVKREVPLACSLGQGGEGVEGAA